MPKEKKDKHFLKKPWYPGGRQALLQFISKNKRYPQEALEKDVEGTVSLKYTIDHLGKVIEARVINGIGHGCDEEAVRLVKLLKFRVPKTHKIKVRFYKDIHIHFRLPAKQQQEAPTFAYTTPSSESQREGYSYTITIKKG